MRHDSDYELLVRRMGPRLSVDSFCTVISEHDERHAAVLELSSDGLRVERPFDPKRATRVVQLELELPETDDIIWARGHVRFAQLTPMGGTHPDGAPRLLCRAGIHIAVAGLRDRKLLRDYVGDLAGRARQAMTTPLAAWLPSGT